MLRSRRNRVLACEGLLVASIVSISVQSHFGDGPNAGSVPGNLIGVGLIAAPALLVVGLTSRWRIWPVECALSAPWLLIGMAGDLSGTDAGFVMIVPAFLALPQLGLVLLALVFPGLRRRSSDGTARP